MYHKATDPYIRHREAVEASVVRRLVSALINAGYFLSVDDRENEPVPPTQDRKILYHNLMECDEEFLLVYHPGEKKAFGIVQLVYGNDGWDVICDYTVNLDSFIEPLYEWAEKFAR